MGVHTTKGCRLAAAILLPALLALLAACTPAEPAFAPSSSVAPVSIAATPPASSSQPSKPKYYPPIDFYDLIGQNADISGWLTVEGTNIDYPVTCTTDNAFYLTHDAYKNSYIGGALFIDMGNRPDFQDPVTLIYGHVMPDDTIFSQLHLYKDAEFFAENQTVTLHVPYNTYTYEVFAAFPHDDTNILYEKNYYDPAVLEELLAMIAQTAEDAPNEANLSPADVSADDRLLLLSTCDNEGVSRYILAARLVSMAAEE